MLIPNVVWPIKIQKLSSLNWSAHIWKCALELDTDVSNKIMWHNIRDNDTHNAFMIFKTYYNDELIDNIAIDTYEQ